MFAVHSLTSLDLTFSWLLYLLLGFFGLTIIVGAFERRSGRRNRMEARRAERKTALPGEKSKNGKHAGRLRKPGVATRQ